MQIQTENLGKRFKREWIFRGLTHSFQPGKSYAILGPNGSGKSTLLQTLWGQLLPSAGSIRFLENEQALPAEDWYRHVAIATPYMELIDEFSLVEMVHFHFKFKQLAKGITLPEVIDKMELGHAKTKHISQFSSGMRQRLKLALAFYTQTDALFLDEPTTNLDKNATSWYQKHLFSTEIPLVFIASNQEHEYPETAIKINMADYK